MEDIVKIFKQTKGTIKTKCISITNSLNIDLVFCTKDYLIRNSRNKNNNVLASCNGNEILLLSLKDKFDLFTFFHELAHAIHARIAGELKGAQTAEQETVAEFTAAVLMDLYGYSDHTGNAWQYISHNAKDPLIAISKAMGTTEKVLKVLLES